MKINLLPRSICPLLLSAVSTFTIALEVTLASRNAAGQSASPVSEVHPGWRIPGVLIHAYSPGDYLEPVIAVSPSGNCLASSGPDGSCRLWDIDSKPAQRRRADLVPNSFDDIRFSWDARWVLISKSNGPYRLYEGGSGRLVWSSSFDAGGIARCYPVFSSDSKFVAVREWNDLVHVLDLATQKEVLSLDISLANKEALEPGAAVDNCDPVTCMRLDMCNGIACLLWLDGLGTVRSRDIANGRVRRKSGSHLTEKEHWATAADPERGWSMSRSGKWIILRTSDKLTAWSHSPTSRVDYQSRGRITDSVFAEDARAVYFIESGKPCVLSLDNGHVRDLPSTTGQWRSICASESGDVVCGMGATGHVYICHPRQGIGPIGREVPERVHKVVWQPDSQQLGICGVGRLSVWDTTARKERWSKSSSGSLFIQSDMKTWIDVRSVGGEPVAAVSTRSGEEAFERRILEGIQGEYLDSGVAIGHIERDGRSSVVLATQKHGGERDVLVADMFTSAFEVKSSWRRTCDLPVQPRLSAFSVSRHFAIGGIRAGLGNKAFPDEVQIFDADLGIPTFRARAKQGEELLAIALQKDGSRLIVVSNAKPSLAAQTGAKSSRVVLYDACNELAQEELGILPYDVRSIAFVDDSEALVGTGAGELLQCSLKPFAVKSRLKVHAGPVQTIDVSEDLEWIAASGKDCSLRIVPREWRE